MKIVIELDDTEVENFIKDEYCKRKYIQCVAEAKLNPSLKCSTCQYNLRDSNGIVGKKPHFGEVAGKVKDIILQGAGL